MIAAPPPTKIASSYSLPSRAYRAQTLRFAHVTDTAHLKLMGCYFTMLGVTLFWLVALTRYAQKPGCLPWCLSFTFISFALAIQLFLEQIKRTQAPQAYLANRESRSLLEMLTAAYAVASLAICIAFTHTQWYKIDRTVLTQQVIEIDLSPATNAIAEHIPLAKQPSHTAQKLSTAKIATAVKSSAAPHAAQPTAQPAVSRSAQSIAQSAAQPITHPVIKPSTVTTSSFPNVSASTRNKTVAWPPAFPLTSVSKTARTGTATHAPVASTGSSFFMEEVPPAQLVEVRETESSKPAALRSPANSANPSVNMSVLAEYLRELHRIIKASWTPPRDTTRSAEIVFRIKRSGELALIKVVRSSGDTDSDESAITAITAAAPFKPLPAAYSLASLDVDYTFNYSMDKLTEVNSRYH